MWVASVQAPHSGAGALWTKAASRVLALLLPSTGVASAPEVEHAFSALCSQGDSVATTVLTGQTSCCTCINDLIVVMNGEEESL